MMKQFIDHILSMRAAIVVSAICLCAVTAAAQSKGKFSPEKYQAELEQFITSEAGLSAQEAADFFPLLREMQEKQRAIYNQLKAAARTKPADENGCKKAIQKRDQMELELKSIQQMYHNKFLGVLPASKVLGAIMAEERFNRKMFRNWGMGRGPQGRRHGHSSQIKK
jgi:hypothetical protein